MSTTVLRRGARCPLLSTRLALGHPSTAIQTCRSLSTSAHHLKHKLPATNWGSAPPPRDWGSAPPARDRGPTAPPARNGGPPTARPANAGGRGGPRPPRMGDHFGSGERRQRGGRSGSFPSRPWDREPSGGAVNAGARGGFPSSRQTQAPPEVDSSADYSTSEPYQRSSRWEDDDGDRGRSRGRGKRDRDRGDREQRESRSLLHARDGSDYLPPSHHHSEKGKYSKSEKDKPINKRAWVVDDDEAMIAARDEFLRQEAEKMRKAAEKLRKAREAKDKQAVTEKDVFIPENISVAQLAEKFGVKVIWLMRKMQRMGMDTSQCRPDYLLNSEDSSNLALEYNLNPIIDVEKSFDIYPEPETDAELAKCPLRPPVVTIMGHVDHGKTTLLDSLRKTSVAAGEAGGITQHIAAFSVPLNSILPSGAPKTDATITFLDTPGHAAFTGMRARGASVTDLVVLVVAADDGVMPQTKEVIELVKAAGDTVGLVVAINKCDKPVVDIDRVKAGLGAEGIILEEDGGDVPAVRVSGLTGLGLDDLVETLSTLAELRELRAREHGKAEGYVLESHVNKGLGVVSTVLVSRGVLHTGAAIVAGQTWARVRTMTDSTGKEITSAGPGTPVTITGWKDVPVAGDRMLESVNGEDEAKKAVDNRLRDIERKALAVDSEQINARREADRLRAAAEAEDIKAAKEAGKNVGHFVQALRRTANNPEVGKKELRLVIKGDVSGTVEAVVGSLSPIGNAEACVKILNTGVGDVNESDIMLAEASEATVIGFNVECPRPIQTLANVSGVPIMVDTVIYRLIDSVRNRVTALLPPKIEYRITGEAVVQQVFEIKISRREVNVVAGCKVGNGIISKNEGVRVLRGPDREVVYEGTIETLKQFKKDVTEIRKGTECGIGLVGFPTVKEGDVIATFNKVEVPRTL